MEQKDNSTWHRGDRARVGNFCSELGFNSVSRNSKLTRKKSKNLTDFNQKINFLFLIIRQQLRISVHPGAVWQFEKISPTANFYTRSNSCFTDRIVIERRYFSLSSCQELYLFGITEMPVIKFAVAGIIFISPDLAVLIRIIAKKTRAHKPLRHNLRH